MRPIDADALVPFSGVIPKECDADSFMRGMEEVLERLRNTPTIEPKRGEWVLDPNGMDWNIPAWRCSKCGFVANYIGVEANGFGSNPMNWAGSNYCPNCGADMRKGADNETAT